MELLCVTLKTLYLYFGLCCPGRQLAKEVGHNPVTRCANISDVRQRAHKTHIHWKRRQLWQLCHRDGTGGDKDQFLRIGFSVAIKELLTATVLRRPTGRVFSHLHLLLHTDAHTHTPELTGMASSIWEAVAVVLKHHSACINSHKYSWPWTWLAALFMLCMSTRPGERQTEGAVRERGRKKEKKERGRVGKKDGNEEKRQRKRNTGKECDKNCCWLIYTLCYT